MSNPYPPGPPGPPGSGGPQPPQGGGRPPQGGYPPPGQPPAGPPPGQGPQWQPGPGPQGGPPQGPPQGPPPGRPPGPGGPYGPPPGGQPPYAPGPEQGSGGGGKRGLVIGLAVVLVAVLGGGVAFGISWLRGTGPQPAEALPSDAIGYVRFDQKPSGDQQLKAYNFIKNFPELADEILGEESEPIFQQALESAQKEDECKGVDYAEDVEPWLGDAIGVAILPSSGEDGEPKVAGAIEASNEEDSIAGMKKLVKACDGKEDEAGYAYRDGFLIVANTQGEADDYAEAEETLADNENFKADVGALGEEGIFSFWMDLGEVMKVGGGGEEAAEMGVDINKIADEAGRLTGALRFDDSYVELTGNVTGVEAVTEVDSGATKVAELPDSTIGALAFSGGREGFTDGYDQIQEQLPAEMLQQLEGQLGAFEQEFDLTFPDDLATLFGDNFALAIDESALDTLAGMGAMGLNGGDTFGRAAIDVEGGAVRGGIAQGGVPTETPLEAYPGIGVRIDAEQIDGVKDVIGKLTEAAGAMAGGPIEVPQASSDGTVTVATDQGYADQLLEGGALGEDESFQLAVPDADSAQSVFYVNLDKIIAKLPAEAKAEAGESLDALAAFGASGTTSDGGGSFTVRLVAK